MAEEIEKIYVIPLNKKGFKRTRAAPTAVKRVKSYLTKHMKVEEENIWIDASLNNYIWSKGKYNIDSKIRVKAVKFDDGVVEAYLPELEFKKSRREILKEEKAKKEPILKKEEKPEGEGEEVSGAEDYDIAPSADGEVKIKKKKVPKEKEPEIKEKKPEPKPITKKEEKTKEPKKEEKKPEQKPADKTEEKKKEPIKEEKKPEPKPADKTEEKAKEPKKEEKKPDPKPVKKPEEKKPVTKTEEKAKEPKKEEKKVK